MATSVFIVSADYSDSDSDSDILSDGEENNGHDEHKHDHDGRNLENKSVDVVYFDDPMDITTKPCYFAHYSGDDDSYRGIRRTCTAPGCGIYICFGCEKLGKHKEHQKWIKFRRRRRNFMLC